MKKVLIILAAVVGVIALGNVLIAGAQNGGVRFNTPMGSMMTNYTGNYSGTVPFGRWNHGTYSGTVPFGGQMYSQMAQMEQKVLDDVSAKLGMTSADLLTALRGGQTLTALAQSKNVSLGDLQSAADAARRSVLDDLVKQNLLTQQQEDFMLAHLEDMRILGFGLGMRGHRGGFGFPGRGMMFGFPGRGMMPGYRGYDQQQQPSPTTPAPQG